MQKIERWRVEETSRIVFPRAIISTIFSSGRRIQRRGQGQIRIFIWSNPGF
jgi:hypothetical protein